MIKFTSRSQLDLDLIWLHIAEQSINTADRLINTINAECRRLLSQPNIGENCEQFSPNLRRISCGAYMIYYQMRSHDLEIVRILHGARDTESLF